MEVEALNAFGYLEARSAPHMQPLVSCCAIGWVLSGFAGSLKRFQLVAMGL